MPRRFRGRYGRANARIVHSAEPEIVEEPMEFVSIPFSELPQPDEPPPINPKSSRVATALKNLGQTFMNWFRK